MMNVNQGSGERVQREFVGGSLDGQKKPIPLGIIAVKYLGQVYRFDYNQLKFVLDERKYGDEK